MLTCPIERVVFEFEFVIESVDVVPTTVDTGAPSRDTADADTEELTRA